MGQLDDAQTARKRKELIEMVAMLDVMPIDSGVIERAKRLLAVNVRALDAIHVATAELFATEGRGERLAIWTHDGRQAPAALSRGLVVHGASES